MSDTPSGVITLTDGVVHVPNFRGLQALDAWLLGHDVGLALEGPDPDGPQNLTNGFVTTQQPAPGALVERWSVVHIEIAPDGGWDGVREPRRPPRDPPALAAELDVE